ncbi:MAG: hypothetical protein IT537_28410 [Hyphomicrobiales bacterium]|nr:hypothetical protein [Hyphomicrobiales bacterium]
MKDEQPSNLGLEEVKFDDSQQLWEITLGFSRPWNTTKNALTKIAGETPARRTYRIISVRDIDVGCGDAASRSRRRMIPKLICLDANLLVLLIVGLTHEEYVRSATAVQRPEFLRLGLSDDTMLEVAKNDVLVLSGDVGLYLAALAAGYKAANFTHVIEAARFEP